MLLLSVCVTCRDGGFGHTISLNGQACGWGLHATEVIQNGLKNEKREGFQHKAGRTNS